MDPLQRKPLTRAEKSFPKSTICVTGGAGYVASHLIVRLLAAGHTVHATRRARGDDLLTIQALDTLPGAAERLKWFEADLLQEGSFDAAVAGCEIVFHAAAIVSMGLGAAEGWKRCVAPAVLGVRNVFASLERSPSVKRVIMTSSLGAIVDHRPEGHVFTEEDWATEVALTAGVPYLTAKTFSEWEAWALAAQQRRWQLVVLNPVNIWGPPLAAESEAAAGVKLVKTMVDGSIVPFYIPIDMNTVDVRDVAYAHAAVMANSKAWGRYLLAESSNQSMIDVVALLRERFPWLRVPHIPLGYWASALAGRATKTLSPAFLRLVHNSTSPLSAARARKELGMEFIPLQTTLEDMVDSFVSCGKLPAEPKANGAGCAASKGSGAWLWVLTAAAAALVAAGAAAGLGAWQGAHGAAALQA